MPQMKKLLVPVDFSDCSEAALHYAAELAKRFGASLEVLHVIEVPPYLVPEVIVQGPGGSRQTIRELAGAAANQQLEKVLAELDAEGVPVQGRIETGDAAKRVTELAALDKHDLIVMGTHGRTGLSHFFVGSVAEKVVRMAPCPVLTIRAPETKK
ncbi:MAG: universal stress protein [Deltaproteobacteria bacterium]|nr:universal stress protein [Deltaproteobacteria bacterium]